MAEVAVPLLPPLQADEREADIAVIGAGVIGLSIALRLAQQGAQAGTPPRIVVLDREGVAAGASRGNAGAYAFSDIQPLASPGIVRQVPRCCSTRSARWRCGRPTCRASRRGCGASGAPASRRAWRPARRRRRR